jgi:hypothetical protein
MQRRVVRLTRQLPGYDDAHHGQPPLAIIHARPPLPPRHLPRQVVREAGGDRVQPEALRGSRSDGEGLTSLR